MTSGIVDRRKRRWVRRHPWATTVLVLVLLFFALSVVFAEDRTVSEKASLSIGVAILYAPVLAVTLFVTWLIDRHGRNRVQPPVAVPAVDVASPANETWPWTPDSVARPAAPTELPSARVPSSLSGPSVPPAAFRPLALADLQALPQAEFEQRCVRALTKLGYEQIERTGVSDDLGGELTARDAQGRPVVVRCVRNAPGLGVSSTVIQRFVGLLTADPATERGIVATNTEFTRSALDLARQHDVVLLDGDDLVKILNLLGTPWART